MSSNTFSNLENSKLNGNLILTNGYIQFPNGSQQTEAGGAGGGDVSTNTINTYTNTSVNDFENAEITCATQDSQDNSYLVANTAFVQNVSQNVGKYPNNNLSFGGNNYVNLTTGSSNNAYGNGALNYITTGSFNNTIGESCGLQITNGSGNNLLGYQAGGAITTGSSNVSIGTSSLLISNGNFNVAVGNQAGENDVGLSSNNTYIGNTATQLGSDTYSYNYLTLIGAGSEPILTGINNQIVLGRKNGVDDIYVPSGNIYLGDNVLNSSYVIQASGNNSNIQFKTLPSIGTVYQDTLTLGYTSSTLQSGEIYLTGDVTVSNPYSLTVNNTVYANQGSDPSFGTANAVIYFNASATATQQLRVNINGAQYYINLSPI
jgi:hypothetical protein